jgi:methionyl-tRNA formyltransferase
VTAGPAPGRAADRARTIFFGSGAFAVPILDALAADPRLELVGVVTAPDRPAGRGKLMRPTPVALRAQATWMPLLKPGRLREPEAAAQVAELRPDLGVLADYGQIVPRAILDLPPRGILNIHPSLLPRHRGATPIPATIAAGDERAGVTIIRMDDGVDTGPIVARQSWPLDGTERAPDLEARAAREGAELLARTIESWLAGTAPEIPQTSIGATVTRPFRRADGRLDPDLPAVELERRVRAHEPWPGSYIETSAGRLAIHEASMGDAEADDEPGTLVRHADRLAIVTSDGRLVLDRVQLAGRRELAGDEFLRGQEGLVGTRAGEPGQKPDTGSPVDAVDPDAATAAATSSGAEAVAS